MDSKRLFGMVKDMERRGDSKAAIDEVYEMYCQAVDAERSEMASYVRRVHEKLHAEAEAVRRKLA